MSSRLREARFTSFTRFHLEGNSKCPSEPDFTFFRNQTPQASIKLCSSLCFEDCTKLLLCAGLLQKISKPWVLCLFCQLPNTLLSPTGSSRRVWTFPIHISRRDTNLGLGTFTAPIVVFHSTHDLDSHNHIGSNFIQSAVS